MYRIDENTYIDDSLVTCAEYQLFIDEMRERMEYFQPDHWTSCQFPSGQAHIPILGVRHSDVRVFCDWLTWREPLGEWSFRLPTLYEAEEYHLPPVEQCPLGYWTEGTNTGKFAWATPVPANPRNLGHIAIPYNDIDRPVDIDYALYSADLNTFTANIDRALDRSRVFASDHAPDLDRAVHRAYNRSFWDMYIDLFTLQERIAGRSPAFEGIRIVKERVK